MRWHRWLALLLLVGCNLGPHYQKPPVHLVNQWEDLRMDRLSTEEVELGNWWAGFGDPILDEMIACALANNYDLCAATQRILQAKAMRRIEYSRLFPEVNAEFSVSKEIRSRNRAFGGIELGDADFFIDGWEIGFSATWELDLFGRLRKGVEAASAEVCASVNDRRAILITLLAEVARAYVDVRGFQRRIEVAHDNNRRQETTVEIIGVRVDVGIGTELDLSEAIALQRSVAAAIPPLYESLYAAMHRLAVLCGQQPVAFHDLLAQGGDIPRPPEIIPIGLPCDILCNRPDLRRTEWELRAASARIGIAYAELFPKITLAAVVGLDASDITDLFNIGSRAVQLGADILQPIFNAGRRRSRVYLAKREYEEAVCNFQNLVLTSLEEVRNAIVSFEQEQIRHRLLQEAAQNSRRSLELSTELYKQGLTNFLRVIDAERSVSLFDDDRLEAKASIALNAIDLYVALGGGWTIECENWTPLSQNPAADLTNQNQTSQKRDSKKQGLASENSIAG